MYRRQDAGLHAIVALNSCFTAGEQEFYAEKGFQNEPTRCKACRAGPQGEPSRCGRSP